MIVLLNPDWRVRSDPLQWILEKRMISEKTGEARWDTIGFYRHLEKAVLECARRRINLVDLTVGPEHMTEITDILWRIEEEALRAIRTHRAAQSPNRSPQASTGQQQPF